MSVYHDEVEIEDFEYDEELETYFYPCPCGDRFEITKEDLLNGEEVATCPSCSLLVKVIYNQVSKLAEGKEVFRPILSNAYDLKANPQGSELLTKAEDFVRDKDMLTKPEEPAKIQATN